MEGEGREMQPVDDTKASEKGYCGSTVEGTVLEGRSRYGRRIDPRRDGEDHLAWRNFFTLHRLLSNER